MKIFNQLNENKNLVIALGFFDGIHLGHQAVLKSAVDYAKKNNLKSAVLTFKNSPACYFHGYEPKYLMQNREKFIEDLGIDYLYEIDFNSDLANMTAEDYLNNILIKYFAPKAIFTGFNHTFGINKSGDAQFLKDNQGKYKYFEIPPQKLDDEIISSTVIRNSLTNGNIEKANQMLGHNFTITAKVMYGNKIGRTIGFPTANQNYPENILELPYGVYEVDTNFGKGIANFGIKPTINGDNEPILETHILDFDKDIYEQILTVKFIKKIRNEVKFNSLNELKQQINKDITNL